MIVQVDAGNFNGQSALEPGMSRMRCNVCQALLDTDPVCPPLAIEVLRHHFGVAHADRAAAGVVRVGASEWSDVTDYPAPPPPRGERRGDLAGRRVTDRPGRRAAASLVPPPRAVGLSVSILGPLPSGSTCLRCLLCGAAGRTFPLGDRRGWENNLTPGGWLVDHALRRHADLAVRGSIGLRPGVHFTDGTPAPRTTGPERRDVAGSRRSDDPAVRPSEPPAPEPADLTRSADWRSRRGRASR